MVLDVAVVAEDDHAVLGVSFFCLSRKKAHVVLDVVVVAEEDHVVLDVVVFFVSRYSKTLMWF